MASSIYMDPQLPTHFPHATQENQSTSAHEIRRRHYQLLVSGGISSALAGYGAYALQVINSETPHRVQDGVFPLGFGIGGTLTVLIAMLLYYRTSI